MRRLWIILLSLSVGLLAAAGVWWAARNLSVAPVIKTPTRVFCRLAQNWRHKDESCISGIAASAMGRVGKGNLTGGSKIPIEPVLLRPMMPAATRGIMPMACCLESFEMAAKVTSRQALRAQCLGLNLNLVWKGLKL